jgi:phosphopentomutase
MLYGHRNDAAGYGRAIEEIDTYIKPIMDAMKEYDALIITADHGCDPCVPGTDHTREKVTFLFYGKKTVPKTGGENLGEISGFDYIVQNVKDTL